jgi:predicted Zn-dependent peptidase
MPTALVLATMIVVSVVAFSVQTLTEFFSFSVTSHNMALGVAGGVCAGAVIEVIHRTQRSL